MTKTYQPKGSMCESCRFRSKDCSHLPFNKMQPVLERSDRTVIVRCSHWATLGK